MDGVGAVQGNRNSIATKFADSLASRCFSVIGLRLEED
jgi:hypothetical protein